MRSEPTIKKTAVVLNYYLYVLGGGERSSLAYAKALMDIGYDTRLLAAEHPTLSRERVVQIFGDEFAGVPIETVPAENMWNVLKEKPIDLFVNHSHMSLFPNVGNMGLYVQMFPGRPIRQTTEPQVVADLQTYQRMICISTFVRKCTNEYWDYPPERCPILTPPLGRAASRTALRFTWLMPRKKKQFLNVGRFNPALHNKNQHILIDAFLDARARCAALKDWRLVLAGNVNTEESSQQYYNQCLQLAARDPAAIRLETGVSSTRLFDLMRESYGYVHGAGAFVKESENPEKCEHFGIAIAESMACSCVPLIYRAGGIFDVLADGKGGLSYRTYEELVEGYARVADLYRSPVGFCMRRRNLHATRRLSQRIFTRQLRRILEELTKP